jgi:hypothetical protein
VAAAQNIFSIDADQFDEAGMQQQGLKTTSFCLLAARVNSCPDACLLVYVEL